MRSHSHGRRGKRSVMAVVSLVTISVLAVSTGGLFDSTPAGAQPCITLVGGDYLGTWQETPPFTLGGAADINLVVSGCSFTGTLTFITGTGALAAGDPISGTIGASSFSGTVSGLSFTVFFQGSPLADGSLSGTWGETNAINGGSWIAGPVSNQVTNPSTTALSTGSTTSSSAPIQASVGSPTAGPMAISTAVTTGASLPGYTMLNTFVGITAPTADDTNPLLLTFTLDSSIVNGQNPLSIHVIRDGAAVTQWCPSGAPPITPATDPCEVDPPSIDSAGDVTLSVLTSHASIWGFGVGCSLSIATAAVPSGTIGAPYVAAVTGCGGKTPYKFSKTGRLPKGLKLSRSGVISGTPKRVGTYLFTLKMKDSTKHKHGVVKKQLRITVRN